MAMIVRIFRFRLTFLCHLDKKEKTVVILLANSIFFGVIGKFRLN